MRPLDSISTIARRTEIDRTLDPGHMLSDGQSGACRYIRTRIMSIFRSGYVGTTDRVFETGCQEWGGSGVAHSEGCADVATRRGANKRLEKRLQIPHWARHLKRLSLSADPRPVPPLSRPVPLRACHAPCVPTARLHGPRQALRSAVLIRHRDPCPPRIRHPARYARLRVLRYGPVTHRAWPTARTLRARPSA